MASLLDVNVLIALFDTAHVHHEAAHDWFARSAGEGWATCPITENGFLRIVGHPSYPNSPGSPAATLPYLRRLCALAGHVFWPDDISTLDHARFDGDALVTSNRVTDAYLLALAVTRGGTLITFDRRLSPAPVRRGRPALQILNARKSKEHQWPPRL